MSRFLSKKHSGLTAYTPGEQPSDTQYIKLNTNESPYPPSPAVLAALDTVDKQNLNLYPNPDGAQLIEKLAQTYDVSPSKIVLGNGSDELLAFTFLAFFEKGVVFPDITYGFYPLYCDLYGIPYTELALRDDLSVNIDDYIGISKNIVLANPNAPTGIALPLGDVEKIVRGNPDNLVVIDEAYVDFGGESALSFTKKYDNILVIHTYSKSRSMAGARLAYAVAPEPIADDLRKMKYSFNPYNVNKMTQTLGCAALDDAEYYKEKQKEIIETRAYSAQRLSKLGFEMTDSKANFLFARNSAICGEDLYLKLKAKRVLVRHWNKPRISDYIRITIGTKEQMDTLITAAEEILGG